MEKRALPRNGIRFTFGDGDAHVLEQAVIDVRDDEIGGRRYITELCVRVSAPWAIDSALMRAIPLNRILAAVNTTYDTPRGATAANKAHLRRAVANRPASGAYGDDFYRLVARRYLVLAAAGVRGPAATIAADNDVPTTSVHRWVKEARVRGFLPPGRAGASG